MGFFSNLLKKTNYKELLEKEAIIIDVRTKGEYSLGKIRNSTNIPLDKINAQVHRLKKMNVPVIVCCASGVRSGIAKGQLKMAGIEAYNGGIWSSLNKKI